jgi:predicted aspartyl protease/Flp pilus assembly protein TadD
LTITSVIVAVICLAASATTLGVLGPDKVRTRAERALREGDFAEAEQLYRELISKDAHDNDARLGLSQALLKERKLQDAYDHAARVITADPLSARAHALLGATILASGEFRESLEEFRTALSLNENEAMAIAGLAMIDFYENRLDQAIKGLRRASSLSPGEPDYVFNLAQATTRRERFKEGADAYERFLAISPRTDTERRDKIRGFIDFLRYLGRQNSLYDLSGANHTVISFDSADNRPMLLLRINGEKKPLRFVLDTGSGMSVISDATAKRLGIHPIARGGMARAVGGSGRFEIVYGFLSSIEIGEVQVQNIPVFIRQFYDEKTPVDGYLGISAIVKFVASIDYGEHTFTLDRQRSESKLDLWDMVYRASPKPPIPLGANRLTGIELPLRTTSSGFLSGEVRLDGPDKFWNFIIDTGASVSVISERLAAVDQVNNYPETDKMRVYGAAGITDNVRTLILPRVMMGALTQEKVNVAVLDMDPINETTGFRQSGILGGNFLKHFRIILDFQRGVIRLEPLNKAAKAADSARPEPL